MFKVTRHTSIEALVEHVPDSVSYLFRKGVRCIRCGEPIWGTLEEAAREKEFSDEEIDLVVNELNDLLSSKS